MSKLIKGSGPVPAKGMIVGMNPGKTEVAFGKPFVGRSGKLLDRLLKYVGLEREHLYLTNIYKSGTEDDRAPTKKEIQSHFELLREEINRVQPEIILAMGDAALHALTGLKGITRSRGRLLALLPDYGYYLSSIWDFPSVSRT